MRRELLSKPSTDVEHDLEMRQESLSKPSTDVEIDTLVTPQLEQGQLILLILSS